ncbi:MAG: BTAD domain-containing putative transcriptional regulator [Trueperaceae bacterium]
MPLRQPPVAPNWALPRPRLLGALNAAACPLIAIRAGAGYGKTVLAAQWAASRSGTCWWEFDPSIPQLPSDWNQQESDLVVDGYLPGVEEIDRRLLALIESCPAERHVLLLARAEPTLALGRRRIESTVFDLSSRDLAFTSEEAHELLRAAGGATNREMDAEDSLKALMNRTLGWPAAVRAAVQAITAGDPDDVEAGSVALLGDYIEAEIWRPLDVEQRRFLLSTAVLEELLPAWCDQLVEGGESARALRELRSSESWLLPPGKVGEGFRHHPLMREFLLSRLDEETGRRRQLELRAATVLRQNRRTVEAAGHALTAEAWELAIECLRLGADRAFREGHADLLRDHLARFPAEYRERPELQRIEGYLFWAAGDLEAAKVKARQAADIEDRDLRADALILQSAVHYSQGNFGAELTTLQQAIDLEPPDPFIRGKAWYALGSLHYRAGRIAEAEIALRRAEALTHDGEPVHVAVSSVLALLPLARGTPRSAISGLVRAVEGNRRLGNRRGEAHACYHLAIALNQTGMHQRALNILAEAERMSRELGLAHLAGLIAREIADAHRDLGSADAEERYRRAITELERVGASAGLLHAYHGLSVLRRRRGDSAAARRAAEEALRYEASGDPAFVALIRLHHLVLSGGEATVVHDSLEAALSFAHRYYRVLAYLYAAAAQPTAGRQLTRSPLEIIQDEGLEHLLREEGDLATPWLESQGRHPEQEPDEWRTPRPGLRRIRLYLLGGVTVEGSDGETIRIRPLALRLLGYLALRRGATVDPEQLIEALWPGRGSEMRPTMQTLIWLLRRSLHEYVIGTHPSGYTFDPNGLVWTDTEEFGHSLERARLEEAVALYRGELLPGVEWAQLERRHLENRYLQALEELADARYQQGQLEEGTRLLEKIVAIDPYAEETYRKLIDWHRRAGHEETARRFMREFAWRLEQELGLPAH